MELTRERERSHRYSKAEDEARNSAAKLLDEVETTKRKLSSVSKEYEVKIEALHREHMEA